MIDKLPSDLISVENDGLGPIEKKEVKMIAIKDHPKYSKYFKMIKLGILLL